MCGLFAVDIAGFTDPRRDEYVQLHLRDMMYRILERAFDGSGLPWRACQHEDRGDGVLVIVPPTIPVDGLADPFPSGSAASSVYTTGCRARMLACSFAPPPTSARCIAMLTVSPATPPATCAGCWMRPGSSTS